MYKPMLIDTQLHASACGGGVIDTQLQDDIFHLEREYEQACLETDAVIREMFKARLEMLMVPGIDARLS